MEEQREAPPLSEPHPGAESGQDATSADSPGRLLHLEQSLSALWEQVEAGGRREEQRHREVLQLYAQLQEQQAQQIRAHLERERHKREQVCTASSQTHLRPPAWFTSIHILFLSKITHTCVKKKKILG